MFLSIPILFLFLPPLSPGQHRWREDWDEKDIFQSFPDYDWLQLHAFTAKGLGSPGTEIPQAMVWPNKEMNKQQTFSSHSSRDREVQDHGANRLGV